MAGYEPSAARQHYDEEIQRLRPHLVVDRTGWAVKSAAEAVIAEQDREIARLRTEVARLTLLVPPGRGGPAA